MPKQVFTADRVHAYCLVERSFAFVSLMWGQCFNLVACECGPNVTPLRRARIAEALVVFSAMLVIIIAEYSWFVGLLLDANEIGSEEGAL